MENGFGTQDIITGRGLGIGGFGYGNGGYGPYGSLSANAVRTELGTQAAVQASNCNREIIASDVEGFRNSLDLLTRSQADATTRKEISDNFALLNSKVSNGQLSDAILGGQNRVEDTRISLDNKADIMGQISDLRAENAKCCCDTQLLIVNKTAELAAQAERLDKEAVLRELNTKDRQLQTQSLANLINNGTSTCL